MLAPRERLAAPPSSLPPPGAMQPSAPPSAVSLEAQSLSSWPASLPAHCATLSLARNALRAFGPALPPQCRSLDLEANLVSAAAPGADLAPLLSLSLARNRVVSLRALALATAARLVQLDLRDNFIAAFPADDAALSLPALRYLNLSGNCLTGFAARDGALAALLVLDLSRNQLTAAPRTASLPALRLLLLDDMRIGGAAAGAIGAGAGAGGESASGLRSCSLGALRVRDNQVEHLGVLAGAASGGGCAAPQPPPLRSVAAVDLDGNSLRSFAGLAEAFPCVEHLSLRRNKIAVPLGAGAGASGESEAPPLELPLLSTARLCFNAVEDVACLRGCRRLQRLYATHCGLRALRPAPAWAATLRVLDASHNQLRDEALPGLRGLRALEVLRLRGNLLRSAAALLASAGASELARLVELDVRDNPLSAAAEGADGGRLGRSFGLDGSITARAREAHFGGAAHAVVDDSPLFSVNFAGVWADSPGASPAPWRGLASFLPPAQASADADVCPGADAGPDGGLEGGASALERSRSLQAPPERVDAHASAAPALALRARIVRGLAACLAVLDGLRISSAERAAALAAGSEVQGFAAAATPAASAATSALDGSVSTIGARDGGGGGGGGNFSASLLEAPSPSYAHEYVQEQAHAAARPASPQPLRARHAPMPMTPPPPPPSVPLAAHTLARSQAQASAPSALSLPRAPQLAQPPPLQALPQGFVDVYATASRPAAAPAAPASLGADKPPPSTLMPASPPTRAGGGGSGGSGGRGGERSGYASPASIDSLDPDVDERESAGGGACRASSRGGSLGSRLMPLVAGSAMLPPEPRQVLPAPQVALAAAPAPAGDAAPPLARNPAGVPPNPAPAAVPRPEPAEALVPAPAPEPAPEPARAPAPEPAPAPAPEPMPVSAPSAPEPAENAGILHERALAAAAAAEAAAEAAQLREQLKLEIARREAAEAAAAAAGAAASAAEAGLRSASSATEAAAAAAAAAEQERDRVRAEASAAAAAEAERAHAAAAVEAAEREAREARVRAAAESEARERAAAEAAAREQAAAEVIARERAAAEAAAAAAEAAASDAALAVAAASVAEEAARAPGGRADSRLARPGQVAARRGGGFGGSGGARAGA